MGTEEIRVLASSVVDAAKNHRGIVIAQKDAQWVVLRIWERLRSYRTSEAATAEVRRIVKKWVDGVDSVHSTGGRFSIVSLTFSASLRPNPPWER